MRRLALALALLAASCASTDDTDSARTRKCEQVRDRLIELRLKSTQADAQAHRDALKQAFGDRFVDKCVSGLTAEQIRCALAATETTQALECTRVTAATNK